MRRRWLCVPAIVILLGATIAPADDKAPAGFQPLFNGKDLAGWQVTVELNGVKIVDANLDEHKDRYDKHPGLLRTSGHLGLQSHDGRVEFRNLYVKPL